LSRVLCLRPVARYKRFDQVKGTQLVFSDLGTPLKAVKKELIEFQELQARIEAGTGEDVQIAANLGNEAALAKIEDAEAAQEELDGKGRDWVGAMQAAQRGFSVYDDLKAALVEKGIPEAEIAFIHDYNTDEQKAGLFRKVNAGQIRVLMGSTPKLGAGTNVQERLVALHHLDVPWKPSDVEQREGRIIRQGNTLDAKIPGFEVEVMAYVTQDSLDMRMWQVQETKLKMINHASASQDFARCGAALPPNLRLDPDAFDLWAGQRAHWYFAHRKPYDESSGERERILFPSPIGALLPRVEFDGFKPGILPREPVL
jgi:hypothetical protein